MLPHDCPNDGYYTIANSTSSCFGGTWHTLTEDHTPGDVNGYMMVVNASYTPGDFFVKTVDGLCPNTTYEFAAWMYNVFSHMRAMARELNLTSRLILKQLPVTVLQTYSTGDIPETTNWMQYGFFFYNSGRNKLSRFKNDQ